MKFFLSAPCEPNGKNRNSYALEDIGHDVYCFDYRKQTRANGSSLMNTTLIAAVYEYKPDIFIQIAQGPEAKTLSEIKRYVPTFCWWFDYRPEIPSWIKEYADNSHYFITVVKDWKDIASNVVFMPQAFNKFEHPKVDVAPQYQVSFIGGPGTRHCRRKLLDKLAPVLSQEGIDLNVFGTEGVWRDTMYSVGRYVEKKEFSKTVNSTQINLGLFSFDNMHRPAAYQSNRIHQTIGSGGFFLTYETPQLELLYKPSIEVATYQQKYPMDINDIVVKIKYYLSNEKKREQIRTTGHIRALRDHTYVTRFQQIVALASKV